jgi:hypothetical protein
VETHQSLLAEQLELLVRVLPGLVDVSGQRRDALAGDLAGQIADRALLVAELEEVVHFFE